MLNRAGLIVRPKGPYIEWASNLDDSGIVPSAETEKTIYLIPGYEDDVDALEVLSRCYDIIFEEELFQWHTDDSEWPKNRTFTLFREWFDVEFHSVVEDICAYDLLDDDFA